MKKILLIIALSLTGCVIREYHEVKCYPVGEREMIHCPSSGGEACYKKVVPIYRCY